MDLHLIRWTRDKGPGQKSSELTINFHRQFDLILNEKLIIRHVSNRGNIQKL